MSKWLASRTRIMPAIVPEDRVSGLGVPFVNGCAVVPMLTRVAGIPIPVTEAMAHQWADECDEAAMPAGLAMRDFLRAPDAAEFLVEIAIVNMRSKDAGLRLFKSGNGSLCFGSGVSDGFVASRLLRANMWDTACAVFKERRAQFFVAAPCADCLAIFRGEDEVRDFLGGPALLETPGAISLDPFVLTRDGVAGTRKEAAACG